MKKIWILDGYNVIYAIPALTRTLEISLEAARNALIRLCSDFKRAKGHIADLIIVFDGRRRDFDYASSETNGIRVVYSEHPQDADSKIIELLEDLRGEIIVVSNDHFVCNNARAYQAKTIRSDVFYAEAVRAARPSVKSQPILLKHDDARKITEEYRRILGLD